jgi:hypothetical protein
MQMVMGRAGRWDYNQGKRPDNHAHCNNTMVLVFGSSNNSTKVLGYIESAHKILVSLYSDLVLSW